MAWGFVENADPALSSLVAITDTDEYQALDMWQAQTEKFCSSKTLAKFHKHHVIKDNAHISLNTYSMFKVRF